jgi:hypothetical protein
MLISRIARPQKTTIFVGLWAVWIALSSSGCGKNNTLPVADIVSQIQLKSYEQNNDQWISVSAQFNTGGFALAGINLPIANPNAPGVLYGQLNLVPTLCQKTPCINRGQVTVELNITQTTQVQGTAPTLPNNTPLPVGGLSGATIVSLPVADTGARIYLAFGQDVALFGFALPFAALDPAGKYLPGVNVFEPITFDKISLIAGLFAGATPVSTGIGLFMDLSSVLEEPALSSLAELTSRPLTSSFEGGNLKGEGMPLLPAIEPVNHSSVVVLSPIRPSLATQHKLYLKLYELSQQGLTLSLR